MIRPGAAAGKRAAASVRQQCLARTKYGTLQRRCQHNHARGGDSKTSTYPQKDDNGGSTSRGPSRRTGIVVLAVIGLTVAYGFQQSNTLNSSHKSLNKSTFTPFTVVSKEKVSATCSIFTLEQKSSDAAKAIQNMWTKGVWSVDIKQPQLQIARSYTPLPPLEASAHEDGSNICRLRLLVRREEKGEMSNYIHRTPIGGLLELRGPSVEHTLPQPGNGRRVVFLAGGTGIAPALQIAHAMREGDGHMTILWANRTREDCRDGKSDTIASSGWYDRVRSSLGMSQSTVPAQKANRLESASSKAIVHQLNEIKSTRPGKLVVDYFVDEEGTLMKPGHVLTSTAISIHAQASNSNPGQDLIFVSGPEGFLNYWAGPKEWRDGREFQGPLGGALSRMNLADWQVIKL